MERVHGAEGDHGEAAAEVSARHEVERAVPEERVRVRVHHDGEVRILDPSACAVRACACDCARVCVFARAEVEGEVRAIPFVVECPGAQRGEHEQGMAGVALQGGAFLHPAHHGRVVADAGVEREVAAVAPAQSDRRDRAPTHGIEEEVDGLERVVRHPQGPGEHVGGPPGQHCEGGVGACDPRGDLVQGAVPPERHDHVDPAAGGILGETGGVPAPVRLHDLDVVVTGQFLVHHDGVPGGHRGGERVDDEQQTQGSPR